MPLRVDLNIINQKGTPAFYSDTFANRPAYGFAGRVFISTDTGAIYEDTGSAWTLIADAGAGTTGTLQQVTTNGNTTTQGITITAGGLSSNSLTDTALTTGSVLFSGAGGLLSESNATFFWDNTNKRLGIGNAAPGAPLDIHGTGTAAQFNGTGTNNAYLIFQNAGANKWRVGNLYNAGANSFEFVDAARSTNVMSLRSTGTYQEVYVNGYNTISNIASFSSAGNYAINPSLTLSIPTTTTFNSGASWSGMATSLLNTWGANNTIDQGAVMAGFIGVNRQSFNTAGVSITVTQGSNGARAICGMQVLSQTGGTNAGTISHGASLLVQGVYPSGSANVTYTNYYGLLLNQLDEFGTVTFTNRWGIYQGGASDKNYFAANTLIGTTTDAGYKLDVNGTGRFSSSVLINGALLQIIGPNNAILDITRTTTSQYGFIRYGTSSTNYWRVGLNSNSTNDYIIADDTNSAKLTIASTGAATFSNSVTIRSGNSAIFYRADNAIYTTMYDGGSGATAGFILNNTNSEGFNFQNNGTSIIRMPSTNNVLIGTTTDTGDKLQVVGGIVSRGANAGTYAQNRLSTNYFGFYGSTNFIVYNSDVGTIGTFAYNTGIYTPISDINRKKDFEASKIGLNAILNLKPTLYRMKEDNETVNKQLGFIAQEVKEFIPQAYVENEDFIGLSDRPIIAALVKSIQELNDKLIRNNIN